MQNIGYSLIQSNNEIQSWFDLPSRIDLTNGDQVHAPTVYEIFNDGTKLVNRILDNSQQPNSSFTYHISSNTISFNGTDIVVTPTYAVDPLPVPQPPTLVTAMQAKVALLQANLYTTVQNWVNTQNTEIQLIWNTAPNFSRNSELLIAAANSLSISANTMTALFIAASQISP